MSFSYSLKRNILRVISKDLLPGSLNIKLMRAAGVQIGQRCTGRYGVLINAPKVLSVMLVF